MKVYEAKLGGIGSIGEDTWLVLARTFAEASKKAVATADKKKKDFTHEVDLIALRFVGREAE